MAIVAVDGVPQAELGPAQFHETVNLQLSGRSPAYAVSITIEPFSPGELFGIDDHRTLGLQIERAELQRTGTAQHLVRRLPAGALEPEPHEFLNSYDTVVSNSSFTARWVKKRWRMESAVLEPPVRLRSSGTKEKSILSVGRFFGPDSGHSKRQLEMVRAFRTLHTRFPDWSLHLVGGCSDVDRPYLRLVESEITDLPVHLHVNAAGAVLDDLYGRASIYWHASGLGADPRKNPERMEHFGISVVEAMSAGAVPVVLSTGGPSDIVRHRREGLHYGDLTGLISSTSELVDDEALRDRLAESASTRAIDFGRAAFARKALSLFSQAFA